MTEAILEKILLPDTAEQKPLSAPRSVRRVCFVCTGNTCRSPMAAAVANAWARAYEVPLAASSAGLYAHAGDAISPHAVKALENAHIAPVAGADYHDHTAHPLTDAEVGEAELLVGLSTSHAWELMLRYPDAAGKLAVLEPPVSDPFGGDLARYSACLEEIMQGVHALLFPTEERL